MLQSSNAPLRIRAAMGESDLIAGRVGVGRREWPWRAEFSGADSVRSGSDRLLSAALACNIYSLRALQAAGEIPIRCRDGVMGG